MTCGDPLCAARDAQLERLLSNVDTFALASVKAELQAAREALERVNRTRPVAAAVEVCRALVQMDPRDNTTLLCLFCCQDLEHQGHWKDCAWRRANAVVETTDKRERRAG